MASAIQKQQQIETALEEMERHREAFTASSYKAIVTLLNEQLYQITTDPTVITQADEMRLVTVMFIDVKDSTEMAQRMDPSDWKLLIGGAHERITRVVAQYGGQVGQYLGDGVLCFFGATHSQADDTLRAVSCALAIQKQIRPYASAIHNQHQITFGLRIGMSTGSVVVGMMGNNIRRELLAMGVTTNLAARIQALAPVGGVLIDETTHLRVHHKFLTEALEPLLVKGFSEALRTYHVLERRMQASRRFTDTNVNEIPLPFVGRDRSIAQINALCDEALHTTTCRAITILGDVGLGKSRLLQELMHEQMTRFDQIIMTAHYDIREQTNNLLHNWLSTNCHLQHDTPLQLVEQRVSAYLARLQRVQTTHDVQDITAAFLRLLGFATEPLSTTQKADVEIVLDYFLRVSAHYPLLLLIDDLHWADPQSIAFLGTLAQRSSERSIVIVATARPDYLSRHPDYMGGAGITNQIIRLQRLSDSAIAALIGSILTQIERVPAELAQRLQTRVEGNPLFVREFLKNFFEQGLFQQNENGRWYLSKIHYDHALRTVPPSLINLLQARSDELSSEERYVMQLAAVVGLRFWMNAVEKIATRPISLQAIDNLVLRGIVELAPQTTFPQQDEYRFRHRLYRDVVYAMLPSPQRKQAHRMLAEWLLLRVAARPPLYREVARQFEAAGDHDVALYTYLDATVAAIQRDDLTDAMELIEQGLAIAHNLPRPIALRVVTKLWMWQAVLLTNLERYEEATAAGQSATRLLQELPPDEHIQTHIRVQTTLGEAHTALGHFDDAQNALMYAQANLPTGALSTEAAILSTWGKLALYRGDLTHAASYLEKALTIMESVQDVRQILTILVLSGHVALERGHFVDALDYYEDGLTFAQSRQHIPLQVLCLRRLGLCYLTALQTERAQQCFHEAARLLDHVGMHDGLLDTYLGLTFILQEQSAAGLALIENGEQHMPQDIYANDYRELTHIAALGKMSDHGACYERAVQFCEQTHDRNSLLYARGLRWLSSASTHLQHPDAGQWRYAALQAEKMHGGRDLWLCYANLARYTKDPLQARQYYRAAATALQERVNNLAAAPGLQADFLAVPLVRSILTYATPDQTL